MKQLFVYGTLLKSASHPMYSVLEGRADFLGTGVFTGKLYLVNHYPGAIYSKHDRNAVKGELYRLYNPDHILKMLDDYEGFFISKPDVSEFIRAAVPITLDNGKTCQAWVYLYNHPTHKLTLIPSGDYMSVLR